MLNFIQCPFCAGLEKVSPEAADALANLIAQRSNGGMKNFVQIELDNIRNHILNVAERRPKNRKPIDPLLL